MAIWPLVVAVPVCLVGCRVGSVPMRVMAADWLPVCRRVVDIPSGCAAVMPGCVAMVVAVVGGRLLVLKEMS